VVLIKSGGVQKRQKERPGPKSKFQKILVPVDFSTAAIAALHHALELARATRAKITLLHVVAPSEAADPDAGAQTAALELMALKKKECARTDRIDVQVRTGIPFAEITQHAEREGADLIVLGRRHPDAAVQWANGHTSERIVRYATCPVLLVREPGAALVAG
jgi:nucleotide-binding universal stress UspA family protein